jgi:hypothetical protein
VEERLEWRTVFLPDVLTSEENFAPTIAGAAATRDGDGCCLPSGYAEIAATHTAFQLDHFPLLHGEIIAHPNCICTSITHEGFIGTVYNLEVEEDHTYSVSGVVVHNCLCVLSPVTHQDSAAVIAALARGETVPGGLDTASLASSERREGIMVATRAVSTPPFVPSGTHSTNTSLGSAASVTALPGATIA